MATGSIPLLQLKSIMLKSWVLRLLVLFCYGSSLLGVLHLLSLGACRMIVSMLLLAMLSILCIR